MRKKRSGKKRENAGMGRRGGERKSTIWKSGFLKKKSGKPIRVIPRFKRAYEKGDISSIPKAGKKKKK